MGKKIAVKMWTGAKFDMVLEENDSYEKFVDNLSKLYLSPTENDFYFICNGKIITANTFNTIESNSIIMAFSSSKKTPDNVNVNVNVNHQSSNVSDQLQHGHDHDRDHDQQTYTYDQVKSTIIAFLEFIRTCPQTMDMYHTDFPQLVTEFLHNPDIDKVIKKLLGYSTQILDAMTNNKNITVNIGTKSGVGEIDLTPDDRKNIDELIKMGFDVNDVVVAYIKSGKNKEGVVKMLVKNFD